MRRLFLVGAITTLLVAIGSVTWTAINLNSSKSNVYRVVCSEDGVTQAQVVAILKELDKTGPGVNEAMLRKILSNVGVNLSLIKVIRIIPAAQRRERIPAILILTDPAHEAPAIADFDPGVPADKGPSKKSTQ